MWDLRSAALGAAICGGVLVAVLTELLGPLKWLTLPGVAAAWAVVLTVAVFLGLRWRRGAWRRPYSRPVLRGLDLAMAAWIAVVVVLTALLAVFAAPITYDSMTYHLARVAHWAQNRSVDFYPTHILRQLYQPPWAEYAVLNLFILARGDRLANLVQWISMVVSLVGVSAIAGQLGAGRRGQLLSAFAGATIPMGILQAATTQNDYASALWLVCMVSALLALGRGSQLLAVLGAGASLGLALLTKGTSYVFAAPFVIVFALSGSTRTLSRKLGQGLIIGLCALALNAPHYARNVALFGAPLGPGGEGPYRYANEAFWPTILISNVLRNIALHLATPSPAANSRTEQAVEAMHAMIGIAPDDARSTWPATHFEITTPRAEEDLAPNGVHLLVMLAALAIAWRRRNNRRLVEYAGCLAAAFLLFCVVLRWQPWHSRLQLPLFVLAAPLIGVAFERLRPAVLAIVLAALAISSAYFLTRHPARPLTGRNSILRKTWAEQRARHAGAAYVEAARLVAASGCRDVGLAVGSNDREYFLWALLADQGWRGTLRPVAVGNASARLPSPWPNADDPCAIIREGTALAPALVLGTRHYREAWARDVVQVLTPALTPP